MGPFVHFVEAIQMALILPHGFNPHTYIDRLGPEEALRMWEWIVWGDPLTGEYGRHSKAAAVFLELYARGVVPYVYFGNGPYVHTDGRSEGQLTFDYVCGKLHELQGFDHKLIELFKAQSIVEKDSGQTTAIEAAAAIDLCVRLGLDTIHSTTTVYHSMRSFRDLEGQIEARGLELRLHVEPRPAKAKPPWIKVAHTQIVEQR